MEFLVLIAADGGTGKALLARLIHQASDHRNRSFMKETCGTFSGPRRPGGKARGVFERDGEAGKKIEGEIQKIYDGEHGEGAEGNEGTGKFDTCGAKRFGSSGTRSGAKRNT
jgi:Sigma-54 interaction domain